MKELIKRELGRLNMDARKYFLSDGAWSLFELVDFCLDRLPPSGLFITSFSLSEESVRHLLHLKETGRIVSLKGLFDPSLRKTKTPLLYFAAEVFDHIRFTPNHSKIILFDNPDHPATILASANLGRNRRLECGVIDTTRQTFDFYSSKLQSLFENATPL
jgi:hypothetical protein